ncbi:MAG: flagellar basal-body rod protein FlgC [Actinomycetota bacterium]|jgi:flagellar basal-body rod protein FlgC|nr:flagellar basal body rod protein [Cryptosporangiaceae bacterium]MDQ1676808.1 flagellar basal-body rod protein FlgC [Actinomycetota bacterium]
MPLFGAIGTAGTGVTVYRKWLDAISDNIANINTVRPTSGPAFQERFVIAQSVTSPDGTGGVQVGGIALGNAAGRMVYDPQHPMADAGGYVRMPDIDLGSQMTQMIMAQRGYEANLAVVDRAKDAYQAAIQLGRN